MTLKPSVAGNTYLRTPGTANIVITATGYANSTISQTINAGVVDHMLVVQDIVSPVNNGGQFATQPIVALKDQYNNTITTDNSTIITVSKKDAGSWSLTGVTTGTAINGVVSFNDLGATNTAAVSNSQLAFNTAGLSEILSAGVTLPGPTSSGGPSDSKKNNTPTGTTTTVIVNGQSQDAGTTTTSKDGDKTVTTVTVDDKKIQERINEEGTNATVSIPISGNSDIGEGVLNGQTVKSMEDKEAVLEIKTESVSYTLPASEINIGDVSAQFGEAVQLKDIKISVKIAEPPADTARIVEDTANKNSYQIVVKPVEFEITCTSGEKTVSVSKFNGYVERTVAIPDGVDPSKITTGIVLNADGTFSHVPTTIVKIDGKYYAKINSLTNSTYSVIYNPVEFADVAKHWAQDSINDMGSRLIVSGSGNGNYSPNKEIARAEFAAIVIRALGLKAETAESRFADVKTSAWYAGYVETAVSYGIITGYSNGKFGPNDKITREQAMTMIARAMKLTGLYSTLTDAEMSTQISSYADGTSSSKYAKEGIAACLKTGVVSGKSSGKLAPKDYITRAEVAVIIERMLEKSELI